MLSAVRRTMFPGVSRPEPGRNIPSCLPPRDLSRGQTITTTWSLKSFYCEVKSNNFDLDPPHQRNVIKTEKWREGVLISMLTGKHVPSPVFHHFSLPNGRIIKQSVDGKQRCMAVIGFFDNKFTVYGKYYNEMSPEDRSVIENLMLHVAIYPYQLTPEELYEEFKKFQETDKTSLGEFFNSGGSISKFRIFALKMLDMDIVKKPLEYIKKVNKNGEGDRFYHLEIFLRCLYAFMNASHDGYKNPEPGALVEWYDSDDFESLTRADKGKFVSQFVKVFDFLVRMGKRIRDKSTEGVYSPFFLYFHFKGDIEKLEEYINKCYRETDCKRGFSFNKMFGNDNGSKTSNYDRYKKLRAAVENM